MSDIKDYFTSRWEDGMLMELDYSQLEVVALAILSGDSNLKADLKSGMDMHRVRAAQLLGKNENDVTKAERKLAKAFSFQLQYGAGAKSMAASNDVPLQLAKDFIDMYYARYYRVKTWQDANIKNVQVSRRPSSRKTQKGVPAGLGYLQSLTDRRYVFFEEDDWSGGASFSPTKIKNYPVQGFATGDIVPIMLGELFDRVNQIEICEVKLINTVHDSVLLDVHTVESDILTTVGSVCKQTLERAPSVMQDLFGVHFDLPLPVEVSVGKTWGSMEELDI